MTELDLRSMTTILNTLDALVYVSDIDTYELIFMNHYGEQQWGRNWAGKRCWQVMQAGQDGPCLFCHGHPQKSQDKTNPLSNVREFQSLISGRWFECRGRSVSLMDGRIVRVEIAVDITERKMLEKDLRHAREDAEQRARIDVLTQLMSRRAFFEDAEAIFSDAKRKLQKHCVAMMDVDRFKKINDQYGHSVGDEVLREIGLKITQGLRNTDIGGRLGGEEFALIFPDTDIHVAKAMCEGICHSIGALKFDSAGKPFHVSCSVGLVAHESQQGAVDSALALADKALYEAKKQGRNRIRVSSRRSSAPISAKGEVDGNG